ncbi:MAG: efflux transporter outer membrane subunit [Desulfuromonadales bacterium]|nr:efflux transporter outer membrane subunit [Desulfuromonadales bacterium]
MNCYKKIQGTGRLLLQGLFIAFLLFVVTACSVGPNYVKPGVTVPQAFKEEKGWKAASPNDGKLGGKWWELFGDNDLSKLVEQVEVSNQNVAAAEASLRQARAMVKESQAGYMPTVAIGFGASRGRNSSNLGTAGNTSSTSSDFSLPLDFSWELDIWGKIRRTVEASKANLQSTSANYASVRLAAQAEVALDYFQIRTIDVQKQLLDETVDNYQKSLDLTKNRYNAGVAAKTDVLQAESQLKAVQAQVLDLAIQRAQLEHAIAILIGKAPADFSLPVITTMPTLPGVPVGVPSELLERRPDIAAAERQIAVANANIGVAQAAYYPTISINGSIGFEASDIAKLFAWPSRFWSLGGSASQTLFDGGFRGAQKEQMEGAYDATVATYRQTVLTALQEVEDNLVALRVLQDELKVLNESADAARQTTVATMNQYKSGTVGYLNVLVAQSTELSARINVINAEGRQFSASVTLIKALGGGWNVSGM